MTTGLAIFAATYFLIAVQRLPFVHLNRPPDCPTGDSRSAPWR